MSEFLCELLAKRHDRERFRCGVPALEEWLQRQARQDQDRHIAAVYVFVPISDPARIAGFYTLSATSIVLSGLPSEFVRKLPKYPVVPAILLGRLARDLDFPGLGKELLFDALHRAWRHSFDVAAAVVVVDAKDDNARDFYARHGFAQLTTTPQRLVLPIKTVEKIMKR